MRLLIVGDIHFRAKRLTDISEAWQRAVNWAKQKKVDVIIQAGDLFEKPNIFGREADVGTICSAFLAPFMENSSASLRTTQPFCKLFMVPGNHDMGGPRDEDALAVFDCHQWMTIPHGPCVLKVQTGLSVCAVPWLNRAKIVARLLDKGMTAKKASEAVSNAYQNMLSGLRKATEEHQKNGQFVIFLGHMEITGAQRGTDIQSGGTFEFSPEQLADIGADAYALGHIHIRQSIGAFPNKNDGYLGTLCQLSYGEENNQCGFRYVETEGRQIKEDRFVNNERSPRYFTTSDIASLQCYRAGVDYVKLRGETRPDSLPELVQFEKTVTHSVAERRIDKRLTADMPMEDILPIWAKESKCEIPIDKLLDTAKQIEAMTQMPTEVVGSLETIDRICLKNIASHEETQLDLSGIRGLCGIEGPTGSGKTTVLESPLVALYGHCPSRPSLQNIIRNRENSTQGLVEVDFTCNGKKMTARRELKKTDKTFSHKAYLFESNDGQQTAIAGPKVDDVNKASSLMVGDLGLIMAGVFSAQDEVNNIVNLDPAPRKEVFSKLMGSDKYLAMGKILDRESKNDNVSMEASKARAASLRIDVSSEVQAMEDLQEATKQAEEARKKMQDSSAILRDLQIKQAQAEASREQAKKASARASELKEKKNEILHTAKNLKTRLDDIHPDDEGPIKEQLESLKSKSKELGIKSKQVTTAERAVSKLREESSEIRAEIDRRRSDRAEAYRAYEREVSEKRQQAIDKRATKREAIASKLTELDSELAALSARRDQTAQQVGLLDRIPGVEACKKCVLAESGYEAKNSLYELDVAIERVHERIYKGKSVLEHYDAETKRQVAEIIPVPDSQWQIEEMGAIASLETKHEKLKKDAEASMPDPSLQKECDRLAKEIAKIPEIETKLEQARAYSVEIAKINERLKALKEAFDHAEKELSSIGIPDGTGPDYSRELQETAKKFKEHEANASEMDKKLAKAEVQLEALEKSKKALKDLEASIEQQDEKLSTMNALRSAFSRDGIPQLIVDSTVPHIQAIMTDLLGEFDGRFSIQIRTQKEAKGDKREVIDIIVDDGYGERDIKTYSGGEKQLLKTIIRIAFATLQAERSGKGLKVLVLDEATDAMDPTLAEAFIKMLGKLTTFFNQVFVVSHNDYVLSTLENRIIFHVNEDRTGVISC